MFRDNLDIFYPLSGTDPSLARDRRLTHHTIEIIAHNRQTLSGTRRARRARRRGHGRDGCPSGDDRPRPPLYRIRHLINWFSKQVQPCYTNQVILFHIRRDERALCKESGKVVAGKPHSRDSTLRPNPERVGCLFFGRRPFPDLNARPDRLPWNF